MALSVFGRQKRTTENNSFTAQKSGELVRFFSYFLINLAAYLCGNFCLNNRICLSSGSLVLHLSCRFIS